MLKNRMLWLVCGIPLASVLLGIVMVVLAVQSPDTWLEPAMLPLSKTNS